MNATNEERRCRCDVLITSEAQNLKESGALVWNDISQRDAQGQHEVAVKHTRWAGEIYRLRRKWRLGGQ